MYQISILPSIFFQFAARHLKLYIVGHYWVIFVKDNPGQKTGALLSVTNLLSAHGKHRGKDKEKLISHPLRMQKL